MLFGHLAVSTLEHRYLKAELVPVMAAAVLPDAIDKVAHYVIGGTTTGRLWGHTLIGAVASSVVVLLLFGKRNAASWALGYVSHLICDLGSVVPWFYPFAVYEFPPAEDFATTLWMGLAQPRIILEILLSVWAFLALRRRLKAATLAIRSRIQESWRRAQGESAHS